MFIFDTMKKILALILIVFAVSLQAQEDKDPFTVVFYNVENLFDTLDHPDKKDEEFMPGTEKNWNTARYSKKLNMLATVIDSIGKDDMPSIIGLCEVENKRVLVDLVIKTGLKDEGYKVVREESPDFRGIDVALLYNEKDFTYLEHRKIPVEFKDQGSYTTRDILYVKGEGPDKEILHFFVNHWPSRRGGLEKSEPRRTRAAQVLKDNVDNILKEDENASIVIMGDFNDEPQNNSINKTLGAGKSNKSKLVNLMYDMNTKEVGTYKYKDNWNMLDQFIISSGLMDDKGLKAGMNSAGIYREDWILYYSKKYGDYSPNRTYGGPNYYGGYSDHLAIYLRLKGK